MSRYPHAELPRGTIIGGDYEIQSRLGGGGMGVVYAARQLTTGYTRAIKVMASFTSDPRARSRFEQEARICANIQSDHVVQVLASGVDPVAQTPWIAMELLTGSDLERHLNSYGRMRTGEVLAVIRQVGHALAAAHDLAIVHRDIKPENIFLAVSRVIDVPYMVKVLDFGIAKLRSDARVATSALGTPVYMAPEQTGPTDALSPAADVWSLALVVFRMLTGKLFWLSENRADGQPGSLSMLWRELLVDPLPSASERASALGCELVLPRGFDAWFGRCIEREPAARFPHAREALVALEPLLVQAAAVPDRAAPRTPSMPPVSIAGRGSNGGRNGGDAAVMGTNATQISATPVAMLAAAAAVNPPAVMLAAGAVGTPPLVTLHPSRRAQASSAKACHRVAFREEDERIVTNCDDGRTLLEASLDAGIHHYHACGGKARCSTCRVTVLEGASNLGPRTAAEAALVEKRKWPATTRLACQATVHGPVLVRRLVIDTKEAVVADLRSTRETELSVEIMTVLALRIDGIDAAVGDVLPDDALHTLERSVAVLEALIRENNGRLVGIEGSILIAVFDADADGVRRALRVGLRSSARIRQLNSYLVKHFGVSVHVSGGLGRGYYVEGPAGGTSASTLVLLGTGPRDARQSAAASAPGHVLAPVELLRGIDSLRDVVTREASPGFIEVIDFAKDDVVYLVQTTFDALGDGPTFVRAFYDELFRLHPASRGMFAHVDMDRQRQMLLDTLGYAIRGLDDFSKIEQTVRDLGARHVDYGVTLADYNHVGRALIHALAEQLGDAFTPEVEIAWREIYGTLVRTMTSVGPGHATTDVAPAASQRSR